MLSAGTRLGPYEIVTPLGAGGMGEVYQARDTRLDRVVAIKVLPDGFADDPQFRERFDREARVVSQLTHPHICTLHDVGEHDGVAFLVMECLEGETLADRLARAAASGRPALPLADALHIAMQVADALDHAHRAGVVHRDLKPGNIMLTRSGGRSTAAIHAKLLDFGLAKAAVSPPAAGVSLLPTTPPNLTAQGTFLGTLPYMAPEQLEGGDADARTDIFAFGLVVYEMVTGRKVFDGRSQASLIASILERDPAPMSSADCAVPLALESVVRGCLAKHPDDRWQSVRDVLRQLKPIAASLADGVSEASGATAAGHRRRISTPSRVHQMVVPAIALLAGVAIASAYWWSRSSWTTAAPPMYVSIPLEPGANAAAGIFGQFEISPDGKWIAYTALRDGRQHLFLRGIAEPSGKIIEGTDDAKRALFSPDSQWLAFPTGNALKKIPLTGGAPVQICTLTAAAGMGGFVAGHWGIDDTIAFVPQFNAGIWSVAASGGEPKLVLPTDERKDRIAYIYPQVLPGRRGLLFTTVPNRARSTDELDIMVLEAGAAEPRIVIRGGNLARYIPTGHIVYARGEVILAVPFDLSRLEITGTPVPIMSGVQRTPLGDQLFAVADSGTLLYQRATGPVAQSALVEVDRRGAIRPIPEGRGVLNEFSVAPTGRHVAVRVAAQNDDIWTFELPQGSPLRLTFEPGDEIWPQWTPDGTRLAFGSRTGRIFLRPSDGSGQREVIATGEFPRMPTSFSPDGKTLAFTEVHPDRHRDILLLSIDGSRRIEPFLTTDADEGDAKFSPDGRWIAYVSDEQGRHDVYLRPIGSAGARRRVSSDGGAMPVWAPSGRELFYLKGDDLVSVKLDAAGNLTERERLVAAAPKLGDLEFHAGTFGIYDVLPDGQRFVMLLTPKLASPTHYDLVLNWFDQVKRASR
jgi:serine/threonine-protein kinase